MLVDREVIECFISWGELKVLEALNQDELAPLMERVTHGDQKALSDLYDATRSRVFSLALFMVRETDLAEDVVVDVYAQIWRNAASYDESKGGVLNWVLMMTRSRALDVIELGDVFMPERPAWMMRKLCVILRKKGQNRLVWQLTALRKYVERWAHCHWNKEN